MKTELLAKARIRCCKHLHEIGLNSKGQLVIPEHKIKELEGYVMMGDLGNDPCKCAEIYYKWRKGHFKEHPVPVQLSTEKVINDRLCSRILQKRNKQQDWPNIKVASCKLADAIPDSNAHRGYKDGRRPVDCLIEWIIDTVYQTLLLRGIDKKELKISKEWYGRSIDLLTDGASYTLMKFQHRYHDSAITLYVSYDLLMAIKDPKEDINWRLIIDTIEKRIIQFKIANKQVQTFNKQKDNSSKLFEKMRGEFTDLPTNMALQEDGEATAQLTVRHTKLTTHTAKILTRLYIEFQNKIKGLLAANEKRLANPNRYPESPGYGVGAITKKNELEQVHAFS